MNIRKTTMILTKINQTVNYVLIKMIGITNKLVQFNKLLKTQEIKKMNLRILQGVILL